MQVKRSVQRRLLCRVLDSSCRCCPTLRRSDPLKAAVHARIGPQLLQLSVSMADRLRFPPDYARWTADRRDAFKHSFRYDVMDVLLACAEVAGSQAVLHALANKLQADLAKWSAAAASTNTATWTAVEAALYAIRAIARHVADDESAVLPPLFNLLIHSLPIAGASMDAVRGGGADGAMELACTAFRLVGRYHRWLAAHPSVLRPALEFVVRNGLQQSPGASVDAVAFASPVQVSSGAVGNGVAGHVDAVGTTSHHVNTNCTAGMRRKCCA